MVVFACELSVGAYVALFAYPGLSLTLLRSYAEHHPAAERDRRTAIVLGGPLSRLLYLNNNLHVVHHSRPDLPWHAIPAAFSARRGHYTAEAGGHVYAGYPTLLRRFLFRAGRHPVHPDHRLGYSRVAARHPLAGRNRRLPGLSGQAMRPLPATRSRP